MLPIEMDWDQYFEYYLPADMRDNVERIRAVLIQTSMLMQAHWT